MRRDDHPERIHEDLPQMWEGIPEPKKERRESCKRADDQEMPKERGKIPKQGHKQEEKETAEEKKEMKTDSSFRRSVTSSKYQKMCRGFRTIGS